MGPLDVSDAEALVAEMKAGETVLPGRGLADEGFALPWDQSPQAPVPGPQDEAPAHPDVSPAGGTWKDMEAEKVEGDAHDVRAPAPAQPLDPGTARGGRGDEE